MTCLAKIFFSHHFVEVTKSLDGYMQEQKHRICVTFTKTMLYLTDGPVLQLSFGKHIFIVFMINYYSSFSHRRRRIFYLINNILNKIDQHLSAKRLKKTERKRTSETKHLKQLPLCVNHNSTFVFKHSK